jgi:hypothetical protein
MSDTRLQLREAVNVDDLKARDRLVRRFRKLRADAVLDKNTYEHWNRAHPDAKPIDTSWCDEIIAWCDGRGPLPQCAKVAYYCMACPEVFYDAKTSNAHHDKTGHHQHWKPEHGFAARQGEVSRG